MDEFMSNIGNNTYAKFEALALLPRPFLMDLLKGPKLMRAGGSLALNWSIGIISLLIGALAIPYFISHIRTVNFQPIALLGLFFSIFILFLRPFLAPSIIISSIVFSIYYRTSEMIALNEAVFTFGSCLGIATLISGDYKKANWHRYSILKAPFLIMRLDYHLRLFACYLVSLRILDLFLIAHDIFIKKYTIYMLSILLSFILEGILYYLTKMVIKTQIKNAKNISNSYQRLDYLINCLKEPIPEGIIHFILHEIEKIYLKESYIIYNINKLLESHQYLGKQERLMELIDKLDLRRKQKAAEATQ